MRMDNIPSEAVIENISNRLENLTLGDAPKDWYGWFAFMGLKLALHVAKDPWGFLASVMLMVTPLFLISAYCAYKLAKEVKKQEEEKKLKEKRKAVIAKSRRHAKAD
ncbi:unnamed protein product [Calicophoron daubneyi]|uniref:Small integral membrane protein 15 n=1 Tax=Calicophoron daubneyi TaxID=300641 RepID=A0AAV2TXZ5_CALDB